MQSNPLVAFLVEIFGRISAKSPKFFQIWQWISGAVVAVSGLPALLTALNVVLPPALTVLENKTVGIAASVAFFMSLMTVQTPPQANPPAKLQAKLPFTSKASLVLALLFVSCMAKAQTACDLNPADSTKYITSGIWYWSVPELKEAAKNSYFSVLDMMNGRTQFSKERFDTLLNRYEYWRTVVDLKLKSKKEKDDFHNWVVAEARKEGKLNHPEGEIN